MRSTPKKLIFALVASFVMALALFGCSSSGEGGSASSADAPVGSLLSIHTAGQLDGVAPEDMTKKFCLGCHSLDDIKEATVDYGGTPGFNPHSSHYDAGICTNCHSVDAESVLQCDECHTEDCPEGWVPAPRGENPVWDLKKAFKE